MHIRLQTRHQLVLEILQATPVDNPQILVDLPSLLNSGKHLFGMGLLKLYLTTAVTQNEQRG
ncbi:hypothetical protein D3C85_1508140 [compost metagenome]